MVRFTLLLFVILLSARASIQLSTQVDLAALKLIILAGIFPLFPLLARFFAASLLLVGLGFLFRARAPREATTAFRSFLDFS
jgi:hypothetical protein